MAFLLIEKAIVERVDPLMDDEYRDETGQKRMCKRCNISVRENNDFRDRNGVKIQRQGQSHFCTGWNQEAIKMSKLKVGDEVRITGDSESGNKMFIPTSKGGVSFNIPQPGRTVNVTLPTGKTIQVYGRARPYDMMREPGWDHNWYMHDATTLKVKTIEEATSANAGEFWHTLLKDNRDSIEMYRHGYLKSSAWAQKKKEVLKQDGYDRCKICKSDQDLEVHHETYDNIGKEPTSDLSTLCRPCHSHIHNIITNSPQREP